MKKITLKPVLFLCSVFVSINALAKTIEVSSQEAYDKAQSSAIANDVIIWLPGTYENIYLNINREKVTVKAKLLGKTIFTGNSRDYISGDGAILKGIQFLDGNSGDADVIVLAGDRIRVEEVNIARYSCHKYLYMKRSTQYNVLYKCNFEKRLNDIDKNIISIGVSDKQPGFHKIQYCSFRNFDGTGFDLGVEPIRIGSSARSEFDSKTIVEYCYFTNCNGDGELISNKSCKNIIRYNTFENNPLAEVVLRHGNDTYVYGNFFLKGKGGVRIKEGSNHYIFNNYFSELTGRSIALYTGKQNPAKNIYIMHNTFVNTAKLHLGGNKSVLPKKVVFENNLFAYAPSTSIGNASGKEAWSGNMFQGSLGIPAQKGLKKVSSSLIQNEFGFYELESKSPAVNSAVKSKIKLPVLTGLDADTKLSLDIIKNNRPNDSSQKDVGCQEFRSGVVLKPIATNENTGPSYETVIKKGQPINNSLDQEPLLVINTTKTKKSNTQKPEKELSEVEKLKKQIRELQAKVNKEEERG